jgi:MSHA biogenesis protein MshJ
VIEPKPEACGRGNLPRVYRHGVEVVLRGNYLALLPYLGKLQAYPRPLFWSDVSLEARIPTPRSS